MENEIVKIKRVGEEHFETELNCSIDELLNAISILAKEASDFFTDKEFPADKIEDLLTKAVLSRLNEGD